MKCKEIIKYLEEWAPKAVAWERDNVGLQVGTDERQLKNIMVRSEEHTSELQSHSFISYAVFCLKKKKNKKEK